MVDVTSISRSSSGRAQALGRLGVVDVTDVLLLAMLRRGGGTLVVEPRGEEHDFVYEKDGGSSILVTLPSALADAIVARLALLAGLEVGSPQKQLGRVRVRLAHTSGAADAVQLLVATWATADGLAAEVHHLGGPAPRAPTHLEDGEGPSQVGMYRIVGEIGRGGMGVVYRAEHVALERPVALKVLAPEAASNAALASQFLVEARAACRARHPGIVDVTDFGHLADGRPYLVMELIDAPTLGSLLRREGAFAPARAVALARRIASALEAASNQGVVHRDLTPANVFVYENDKVKIGDFGLARLLDATGAPAAADPTEGGNVMGTATYMSPEQARGEPGDSRSDIYALGCILFKMLTGQAPFSGSEIEILAQHATTPFPPMVGPDGAIPESVERIVLRATAKRPEERYQTLGELLADLSQVSRTLARDDWRRWLPR